MIQGAASTLDDRLAVSFLGLYLNAMMTNESISSALATRKQSSGGAIAETTHETSSDTPEEALYSPVSTPYVLS